MNQFIQRTNFFRRRNRRQDKRERQLQKMSNMRAAKERKRQEAIAAGWTPEPKPGQKWNRFEFGVRDKLTGETHFADLKSVRHASKALNLILKYYESGFKQQI